MRSLSIRWRLTLWYGAVLSVILVGFSGAVYLLMRHHLLALTDAALLGEFSRVRRRGRSQPAASRYYPKSSGHRGSPASTGYEFQVGTPEGKPCSEARGSARRACRTPPAWPAEYTWPIVQASPWTARAGPPGQPRGSWPDGPARDYAAASLAPNARALRELV